MKTRFRRWLFLTHRWLGIIACAFFAMWFVSGVVMMYVGYPKLTEAERLAHLPPLDTATGPWLGPRQALERAGITGPVQELRLAAASGGHPVYLVVPERVPERAAAASTKRRQPSDSGVIVIDASSGQRLEKVDERRVIASTAAFAGPDVGLRYLGTIDEDAFTHSRALDAHRPLHRVQLSDPAGTLLYVSGRSGEVVRDAPRAERLWNYAGAWIHWLYPLRGGALDRYWADIVNWLSIAGIAAALSGTVVGILRWRFIRPYRNGTRTPYPGRLMRWHHVSGLLFAFVIFAWILSGLMSMNPWRIFDTGSPPLDTSALRGGPLEVSTDEASPQALLASAGTGVRELRWTRTLGQTIVLAYGSGGRPRLLDGLTGRAATLDAEALRAAATRLLPDAATRIEHLTDYDLYYYARAPHTMTGGNDRPLPVLRVVFGDARATWVHLDPHTGMVLGRTDSGRRLSRWLFAMLHSWDWLPLLQRRPLWDFVLIASSIGGAALSVTGVVIGWRRLGRTARRAGQLGSCAGSRPCRRPPG